MIIYILGLEDTVGPDEINRRRCNVMQQTDSIFSQSNLK